ncbi:DUF420 domain-containing protein [Magnetospira sp. QH-2]|uniref:DUF420 domain-containing protein n=1 Tax=Magnetospira sp. (strain QH-2) TaxID=1288970 RepID=UPI0003E80D21|nr:DUF420 domain-containing protein [Magnetospira sp. QH-2]CCQ74687.1 conserved membrane protein of unknown function [Magnetospira sp. QH-2]
MTTATLLPHVNAGLNALSTLLLITGFFLIKTGRQETHKKVMIGALTVSAIFLASYLIYHFTAPIFVFRGEGWIRPVYYGMLISHVVLSALVVPMIAMLVWNALKGRFDRHRKWARWTFPTWIYVCVTGVLIYAMLYHLYPSNA